MAKPLFNNHPLGPKDKPMLLDESTIGCFIYPDATPDTIDKLDYSDLNRVYFSTEGLTVCTMDIGPGGFVFNSRGVSVKELDRNIKQLAAVSKKSTVIVRCTMDSPHKFLVDALDTCNKYGMYNLSIFSM